MKYIGVDLGTSALKCVLIDETGKMLASASESYPLLHPHPSWSEQAPEEWFSAFCRAVKNVLKGQDCTDLRGIGLAGQMHGLVTLDAEDVSLRPAILWNDGRSEEEVQYLNETVGIDRLVANTGNIAFAGFTAPKILWMRKHETELFQRISKIMLPKDYLVYRLTGAFTTDYSDASGTLLLDVEHLVWSKEMLALCGISESQVPSLHASHEIVGRILPQWAEELGLPRDCFFVAGASDNMASAIGAARVGEGQCNLSVGTSGTVLVGTKVYKKSENFAIHQFAYGEGSYHFLSCMLSAASANDWWIKNILSGQFSDDQEEMEAKLGKNTVFFLPYLMGERSPHNDPSARAAFVGIHTDTTRADMSLAVMEGVAFGLKDGLEAIRSLGIEVKEATLLGGGGKNHLWQKILANVLDLNLTRLENEEGPALGAAILAVQADGYFASVETASQALVKTKEKIVKDKRLCEHYAQKYLKYKRIYPSLREIYRN